MSHDSTRLIAAAIAVTVLNMLIYVDAGSADFINWDDDVYVYDNPVIAGGLSMDAWRQAWSFDTPPYYMPLTWLSFVVNAELAGIDPGAFHLTNVVLHALSSLLLLLALRLATGDVARSFLAAALFAVHPLHVEGVMWIAQRKEMLSALFGLLMVLAYFVYARRTAAGNRPAARTAYFAMLLALLMSLLSKPMWLTAPALLLLLDAWPLKRLGAGPVRLLMEKVPVLLLCMLVLAVNVAVFAWDAPQLVKSMDVKPFAAGWGTIPISYVAFLWKTFVPYPLAVPYTTFHEPPAPGAVAGSIGVLLFITYLAARSWQRAPWFVVGWLWFIVAATTVLFSFGSGKVTPVADHWTYVPHIGLFAAFAWFVPLKRLAAAVGCLVAVSALAVMAHLQTQNWRDAPALWSHSIAVTDRNHTAHWLWGLYEWNSGDRAKGERLMRRAQRLNPGEPYYVRSLARMLLEADRPEEALAEYKRLLEAPLRDAESLTTAGITLLRVFDPADAAPFFRRAHAFAAASDAAAPNPADFYLWIALAAQGPSAEADAVLRRMLAARGMKLDAFCEQARATLHMLSREDARWARYAPVVNSRCPRRDAA